MADDPSNSIPDADLATVKLYWQALVATGRAVMALAEARDAVVAASGNVMPGASLHLLHEMAGGLMREMGALLVNTGRASSDPAVRAYVALLLDRVHHEPPAVTVPPEPPPPT